MAHVLVVQSVQDLESLLAQYGGKEKDLKAREESQLKEKTFTVEGARVPTVRVNSCCVLMIGF